MKTTRDGHTCNAVQLSLWPPSCTCRRCEDGSCSPVWKTGQFLDVTFQSNEQEGSNWTFRKHFSLKHSQEHLDNNHRIGVPPFPLNTCSCQTRSTHRQGLFPSPPASTVDGPTEVSSNIDSVETALRQLELQKSRGSKICWKCGFFRSARLAKSPTHSVRATSRS